MERDKLRQFLWMITYAVGLVLVVVHIEDIIRGFGFFLGHQTNIIRTSSSLWGTGSDYLFISRDMKTPISRMAC